MLINICVPMAAIVFALALLGALRNRYTVRRGITILLAGICIASCFLFFPVYWSVATTELEKGYSYPPLLRAVAYTLVYSLKSVSGGQEIDVMEKMLLTSASPLIRKLYFGLNYGFFVAAPLCTSTLILSLVGDIYDQLRCRLYMGRRYHVFSELNSNTLDLAKKIREKSPGEMLVFCNTKNTEKEQLSRAKAMGARTLYAPCTSAKLTYRKKQIQFYLISPSEDENLRCTEELICRYRDKTKGTYVINTFAESGTGIQMVEKMNRGNIGVRFVDATALFCNALLLQHPLCDTPEGKNTISVMIVGCDKTGMRMLKTIMWCGIVQGYSLKVRVYDKNAEYQQKKLMAQCPELLGHSDVSFVTVEAEISDLEACVLDPNRGSPDATYIVMAMGDDELNIAVAERLASLFRCHNRYAWMPKILVRIRNSAKADIYSEQDNAYLMQRRIYPFRGIDDIFSEGILHHSYLENLAFAVELCYSNLLPENPMDMTAAQLKAYLGSETVQSKRKEFLQSEYSRRSSMAAALHIPVKLRSCGVLPAEQTIPTPETAQKFQNVLSENPELADRLAENEHLRWNCFMRSEGYSRATWDDLMCFYPKLDKKNNQDPLSKRHLCLVEWEQLGAINEKYLRLDPPEKKNFKKSDYDLVLGIPAIIMLAKRMDEISVDDLMCG